MDGRPLAVFKAQRIGLGRQPLEASPSREPDPQHAHGRQSLILFNLAGKLRLGRVRTLLNFLALSLQLQGLQVVRCGQHCLLAVAVNIGVVHVSGRCGYSTKHQQSRRGERSACRTSRKRVEKEKANCISSCVRRIDAREDPRNDASSRGWRWVNRWVIRRSRCVRVNYVCTVVRHPEQVWWRGMPLKEQRATVFREVLTPQSNNDPLHHTQRLYALSRCTHRIRIDMENIT